jgi:leucyl-tRNA synthetase
MAVPAHDIRDHEFAIKYILDIKESVAPIKWESNVLEYAFVNYWILVDSWEFTSLSTEEAKIKMTEFAEKKWFGHKKVNYKLRDWLFSRQRYWGEPIPLIHLSNEDVKKLPTSKCDFAWVKNWDILMIWDKEFSKIYDWLYGKIVCIGFKRKLRNMQKFESKEELKQQIKDDINNFITNPKT